MKLYRYQSIPSKVACAKEKFSISFTSGIRLVNVYRYQIVIQPHIDAMLFCLDFVDFQILADHTQDVRNWNQGYQYISSTSSLPETELAEIWTMLVLKLAKKKQTLYPHFALNLIVLMVLIEHCTVLYFFMNIISHK